MRVQDKNVVSGICGSYLLPFICPCQEAKCGLSKCMFEFLVTHLLVFKALFGLYANLTRYQTFDSLPGATEAKEFPHFTA